MQDASTAYRQAMSRQSRRQFYMDVTIGVINQTAQNKAYAAGTYEKYSNLEKPFDNYDREYTYATCEQDFWRADGSMLFLPRNGPYFNQGIVSQGIVGVGPSNGSIEIGFKDGPFDIKGLTIEFGEAYPVDFLIESNHNSVQVKGNHNGHFVTEEVFNGADYIRFTPSSMVNGQGRLRILKISMGVGIRFANRQIKSSSKKEFLSWVSAELPTTDFSLRVKNENRRFDVENEDSTLNFLEIGQKVEIGYGATLENGEIERFPGATLLLETWKAGDDEVSFSAKDVISTLNNIYRRGRHGLTNLYDLAVDVLTDAGMDGREYEIDHYLKNVSVMNPIPAVTHAEALQLIANAGRCIILIGRDGKVCLKAGFTTVVSPERMTVESSNAKPWSNLQRVVQPGAKYDYAMYWKDYFKADGSMFFIPKGNNYLEAGYLSDSVADEKGIFLEPPEFTIHLEAAFKYYGLNISFGGNLPSRMVIKTYLEGELQENYVHGEIRNETVVEHEFPLFDAISFSFPVGAPNNGVVVNYVKFGDVTDFSVTYKTMTETPVGERLTKYKELKVQVTRYSESSETKELFKDSVAAGDTYEVWLSNASYGFAVNKGTILESSAYMVLVDLSGLSGMIELIVTGSEYMQSQSDHAVILNTTGETKQWKNPLISEQEHAALIGEWIGNYLNNNIEYQVPYRGDFRPDAGDIIFLQGTKKDELQVFLEEHELSYNAGALAGKIRARRAVDGVETTQNRLAAK